MNHSVCFDHKKSEVLNCASELSVDDLDIYHGSWTSCHFMLLSVCMTFVRSCEQLKFISHVFLLQFWWWIKLFI